jgi:hypothetical protein
MHFQIKGRERRSIHWLIDSWRDIGLEGRRKVRSREVQIIKVESLVSKMKKKCDSEEGKGDTHEGL